MTINQLMQFHEDPAVVAWWRSRLGWALRWLVPSRRRAILAIAAVYIGINTPLREMAKADDLPVPSDWPGLAALVIALFGILWLTYRAALSYKSLPAIIRRHPQLTLHLLYWGALGVLAFSVPEAGSWRSLLLGVAIVFPMLIWRLGYLLVAGQHGRVTGTSFSEQLLVLWPAYGGTATPYGKGLNYLSGFEAKTEEELARSQLAGLKLLILSVFWRIAIFVMDGVVYGPGNPVPRLTDLVTQGAQGPTPEVWASIYCELVSRVLHLAANGHRVIGILRLFGFNVFRNTYKPLLAESILEFWNRYYYYFKELLVTFFFMPTFVGLGRRLAQWPRLRLFAAVFAAAMVGNMYYHLLKLDVLLVQGEVFDAIYALRSRFFYCFLLAIGLYVSMARQQKRGGETQPANQLTRVRRIFGVWTFFGLISIWNLRSSASFSTRVEFFFSLFGLS